MSAPSSGHNGKGPARPRRERGEGVAPRPSAAGPVRPVGGPHGRSASGVPPDDDWPVDRGRPIGLRLLALLGALSFLMIGLSAVVPLLRPPPPEPLPRPPVGTPAA